LYALLLIWAADTGAYFSGRAWGKAKLAPMVSPGKSWAGAWGGIACTTLLTLGVAYYIELGPDRTVMLLLVGAMTAVVSIF
jgi:phosphatidate cytidylyltransferase